MRDDRPETAAAEKPAAGTGKAATAGTATTVKDAKAASAGK
jgi:hypothetical protein